MKLLHCSECKDIKALTQRYRFCSCKKASGHYLEDGNSVTYRGTAIILAMKNEDIEQLPSDESPIVFSYFKQKETYKTMFPKASKAEVHEMGHAPKGSL